MTPNESEIMPVIVETLDERSSRGVSVLARASTRRLSATYADDEGRNMEAGLPSGQSNVAFAGRSWTTQRPARVAAGWPTGGGRFAGSPSRQPRRNDDCSVVTSIAVVSARGCGWSTRSVTGMG